MRLKRLGLIAGLLVFLFVPALPARAHGPVTSRPYWTFSTDEPISCLRLSDVDGDGLLEVLVGTEANRVYVLQGDGSIKWRWEAESAITALSSVAGEGQLQQGLAVGTASGLVTLLDGEKPIWTFNAGSKITDLLHFRIDSSGEHELLVGSQDGLLRALNDAGALLWEYDLGAPLSGLSAGDLYRTGRPIIVPDLAGGRTVITLTGDGKLNWAKDIDGKVAQVALAPDAKTSDGHIAVLTQDWDLLLLDEQGHDLWRNMSLRGTQEAPHSGQLAVGRRQDGALQIAVSVPQPFYSAYVFEQDGTLSWQHETGLGGPGASVQLVSVGPAGGLELLIALSSDEIALVSGPDYEEAVGYRVPGNTGVIAHGDLNGDGIAEVVIGTRTAVQAFGATGSARWDQLWRSSQLGTISALGFVDAIGDRELEVAVGLDSGGLSVLSAEGHSLWNLVLDGPVTAVAGMAENGGAPGFVVAATADGRRPAGVHLLRDGWKFWNAPSGGSITHLTALKAQRTTGVRVLAAVQRHEGQVIAAWDEQGNPLWAIAFADTVERLGSIENQPVVLTSSERAFTLGSSGELTEVGYSGARGLLYDGTSGRPMLPSGMRDEHGVTAERIHSFQVGTDMQLDVAENQVTLHQGGSILLQTKLEAPANGVVYSDADVDGIPVIAISNQRGRVQLFGMSLNQPALLVNPLLSEGPRGYTYSTSVIDPEEDPLTVTLQIWLPAAQKWSAMDQQMLQGGGGRLSWHVDGLFTAWDSGRASRFRFVYDDGTLDGLTVETQGPLSINTRSPLRVFTDLAAPVILLTAVGAVGSYTWRRRRAYRLSSLGQADATLRLLAKMPSEIFWHIRDLAGSHPDAQSVLAYLPGLARERDRPDIAALAEGYSLILARPQLLTEGLRSLVGVLSGLPRFDPRHALLLDAYRASLASLEVSTPGSIASLREELNGLASWHGTQDRQSLLLVQALVQLGRVASILHDEQEVEHLEDKTEYMLRAITELGHSVQGMGGGLSYADWLVLRSIVDRWTALVTEALQSAQARARLDVIPITRYVIASEQVTLAVRVSNVGRGSATAIELQAVPGEDYDVIRGQCEEGKLRPGQRAEMQFTVRPRARERITVNFLLRYADGEQAGKSLAFSLPLRLLDVPSTFTTIANPYTPGIPLRHDSAVFFGREDILSFLYEELADTLGQRVLVLTGQRRMGKTSLLKQLPGRLSASCTAVFIDMQAMAIDPGQASFYHDLAMHISAALGIPEPPPADFAERPGRTFEREFLPRALAAAPGKPLLLLIDEFEELQVRVENGHLDRDIFSHLRHLMQHGNRLRFLFAGSSNLGQLDQGYWSSFLNVALYRRVGRLSQNAARAVVVKPVAGGLFYDDLAVDKALRLTGCHPYLLQLLCHSLVRAANREKRNYVTVMHVNEAIPSVLSLGELFFTFSWEELSDPEKGFLSEIAEHALQPVPAAVGSNRPDASASMQLNDLGEGLVAREILAMRNGPYGRYEFAAELQRLWLVERFL